MKLQQKGTRRQFKPILAVYYKVRVKTEKGQKYITMHEVFDVDKDVAIEQVKKGFRQYGLYAKITKITYINEDRQIYFNSSYCQY